MKYTERIQVLFTEKQYKILEDIAAREHKKLGTLIREAVEETYLKEEKKRKKQDAVESLLKIARKSAATPPEKWREWEEEYAKMKSEQKK